MKNKFLILATALALTASQAFAASIGDDNVDLGKPTSSSDKSITFKGPTSTKKLKGSQAGTLSYNGNALSVGDGANSANKTFTFDKGGSSPFFQYNFSTGAIDTGNLSLFNHTGNNLTVGDGADTNKVLKFNKGANSPEIRYNSATSKLEFSNDASLYKAIGSGTGSGGDGGINLLTNPSFEDGISLDWSNTGGTFTQGTYTNGTESDTKYGNFVASGSGQYFETALKSVPDSLGKGCMADIKYFGGSGNFKLQALDSSANVLSEIVLPNTTAWQKSSTLAYPCPAAGSTMRARVISTGAGTIQADLAYLGGNKNLSQIAQARVAADVKFVGTTSCTLQYGNVSSYATATNAACVGPTIVTQNIGTCLTTDVDGPAVTCNNMPAGEYVLMYTVTLGVNAGSQGGLAVTDGSSTVGHINAPYSGAALYNGTIVGRFNYSTAGSRTWTIVGRGFGNTTLLYNNSPDQNDINLKILYYPTTSETALSPEQSSWFIDANIGGANFAFNSIASTYTEMISPSLDMVINTAKGSADAKIPCSTTNASTGLTCSSGSEGIGVVFTPPYAGFYEVCTDFWFASSSGNATTFQLVETAPASQTIIQEGGQRTGASGGGAQVDSSMHVCGTFNFTSVSEKTIRLMFESPDAVNRVIALGRDANLGQRDLKITVRPVLQSMARPVLTGDQVTTPGANKPVFYSATITGAGVVTETGGADWISSNCAHPATGVWQCTFNSVFSAAPVCVANRRITGTSTWASNNSISTIANISASSVYIWSTVSAFDDEFMLLCHGIK